MPVPRHFFDDANRDSVPDGLEYLLRDENSDGRPDAFEDIIKKLEADIEREVRLLFLQFFLLLLVLFGIIALISFLFFGS